MAQLMALNVLTYVVVRRASHVVAITENFMERLNDEVM